MDSLLFSFFIANPDTKNLYELRKALEIDVLQLILAHYDENEDDRIALEENLEELSQLIAKGATPEKLQENDLAFHHLLGSCTTNPLLEQIYNIVIDFMEPSITATHKRQHGEYVYKVHHDMVDVIRTRNGERISEAVASSVDTWSSLQDL